MNIFYLNHDFRLAALDICDKHVSQMIRETAQMLSTAHWVADKLKPTSEFAQLICKPTHANHPCGVWLRSNKQHYEWLYCYFCVMLDQVYTHRYGRVHYFDRFRIPLSICPANIPFKDQFEKPALAMPDVYKVDCPVESYRRYYIGDKSRFAKWKYSPIPDWWPKKDNFGQFKRFRIPENESFKDWNARMAKLRLGQEVMEE